MVDANIPDIALEPDKTVIKVNLENFFFAYRSIKVTLKKIKIMDRFKLEMNDEQALISLLKDIEKSYDSIVGNITDMIHGYSTLNK
jgi:hypothetical protein